MSGARHQQGCDRRLSPERQRELDRMLELRGATATAIELDVSKALVETLAYGGCARVESVRRVSDAIGVCLGEESVVDVKGRAA